jgi:oligosaccharyltransferase complex subunit beta
MSGAARGFELTFKGPKEETHQLVEYGERNFDHLIMMTPSTSCKSRHTIFNPISCFPSNFYLSLHLDHLTHTKCMNPFLLDNNIAFADHLRPIRLLPTLLESGINTLFLSSPSQTDAISSLYREFDLEFSPSQTSLLTHNPLPGKTGSYVSFDLEDGLHGEVPVSVIPEVVRQKGKRTSGGAGGNVGRKMVVPEGLTHTPGSNPFLIPVLHAPPGTFTGDLPRLSSSDDSSDDDYDDNTEERRTKNKLQQVVAGEEAGLVSVFQSRSNVRFGWVGSVGMVKDDVWTAE